ncbi:MAG: YibE/F family protein [Candidatus Colwellbacteria bacterium]
MHNPRNIFLALLLVTFLISPALAQEVHQDVREVVRARVIEIISETEEFHEGLDLTSKVQLIKAEILEGSKQGEVVEVESDFFHLEEGDVFFMNYLITINGHELYTISEPDRGPTLIIFTLLFVAAVVIFGRWQGVRALLSLVASFFIILYLLVPQLMLGAPPIITSIGLSILILAVAMSITHGINRKTIAAFLGTMFAIIFTGILGWVGVKYAQFSGYTSDDVVYLNLGTGGELNLSGLFLGAIIIGALGLLDDIAITQAAAVKEFLDSKISRKETYKKAMRIGREHVGALVNTLALAYAGASLPLLLLFSMSESPLALILNREIFASEIIRTIVGSIGLVLTVPITTLIATILLAKKGEGDRSK